MKKNALAAESTTNDDGTSVENPGIAGRRVALVTDTAAPRRAPIWEPVARESDLPSSSDVLRVRPKQDLCAELEERIITTVVRPLEAGTTHQVGNDARERELRILFVGLSPIEALTLRRRLDCDRDDDRVAVAFRRLLMERRQRLRALLADPRRVLMKA